MARPLQRPETADLHDGDATGAPSIQLADAASLQGDNPVRRMQRELAVAMSGAGEPRWSARRTLGFVVLTNGLFWAALIWGAAKL
ncbi:hypothetical protein [Phenylobacterium deserti]|uniref:hypothetical protein n=1 Tax=Phenylobacterium deserti TaxID=1914756 RepID=UPI0010576F02|nr:hypothetical protein [Phenylobacterium deserti]